MNLFFHSVALADKIINNFKNDHGKAANRKEWKKTL